MSIRVPQTFQQLNEILNMGKFAWQTARNEVTPDADITANGTEEEKEKEEMSYSYLL